MKTMYKGSESKPVHTTAQAGMIKDGWTYKPQAAKSEEKKESKTTKELSMAEQAEALGIPTVDEDGKKIHHKTLAKRIAEAKHGEQD